MNPPNEPRFYRLTFRSTSTPGQAPPYIRLRRLLKIALRTFGLKCEQFEELETKPKPGEKSDSNG